MDIYVSLFKDISIFIYTCVYNSCLHGRVIHARDGNPGCFQSTGMYKDGHETGLCVVNYNDNFESTYCGMMREGNRHGYGALTYKENNKEYRHEKVRGKTVVGMDSYYLSMDHLVPSACTKTTRPLELT